MVLVVRWRRVILLAATVLAVAGVAVAVGSDEEPLGVLAAAFGVSGVAIILGAVVSVALRWQGSAGFEVDDEHRVFRTPKTAAPVFLGLFVLGAWAGFAAIGGWAWMHGDPDRAWLVFMLLPTAGLVVAGPHAWHGTGFALSADGIRADHWGGRVFVPWEAIGPESVAHTEQRLDLTLADQSRAVRRGVVRRPGRLAFEFMPPEFAAAVVRHYAGQPADRAGIGTEEGHRRIAAMFDLQVRPAGPPPSRGRVIALAVGSALLFGAGTVIQAVEAGFVLRIVGTLVALAGFWLGGDAFRGARARKLLAG